MSTPGPDFATFYAAAWPRLLRTTYAVAGDRQLAEDAAQVALANAYAVWPRVRRTADPFAYVRKAAVNAALSQHRKAHRRRESVVEVLPESPVPVGADPVERETLLGAVRGLPPRQRAVVVLRYYEDLSEQQIAEVLGCRPGTVKSQASAALATLRSVLASDLLDLDELDPGAGDRAGAEREGSRIRRRRRVLAGVSVGVLVVVVGLLAVLRPGGDDGPPEPAPPPAGGEWRTLAPMPLAPRWSPLAVWTGAEVLVLGGGTGVPCPPNASCSDPDEMARDGAAYDPATDSWRRIADAPVDLGYWFRPVVAGDTVVLQAEERFWAYDLGDDVWSALPDPPRRPLDTGALSAREDQVYAVARSGQVLVLDVATRTWSTLPRSPHRPAVRGGPALTTPDGVLVSGAPSPRGWDGERPLFTLVERWDGSAWTRLPETGQVGPLRHWTGERLVEPDIEVARGLAGDPPSGGRLDPATGTWTPLPNAPDPDRPGPTGWSPVAADGPLMAIWGYAYDDREGSWTALGRPPGTPVDTSQSAVWADGTLVVVGGLDSETGYQDAGGLSAGAWAWTS